MEYINNIVDNINNINLCDYKNYFGEPGVGLHTHFFGFAVFDLVLTMVAAFIFMMLLRTTFTEISNSLLFGIILLILLIIGELLHKKFFNCAN